VPLSSFDLTPAFKPLRDESRIAAAVMSVPLVPPAAARLDSAQTLGGQTQKGRAANSQAAQHTNGIVTKGQKSKRKNDADAAVLPLFDQQSVHSAASKTSDGTSVTTRRTWE